MPDRRNHDLQIWYCRTGFDSDGLTAVKIATKNELLSLEFAMEITAIIPYVGVVFSFV